MASRFLFCCCKYSQRGRKKTPIDSKMVGWAKEIGFYYEREMSPWKGQLPLETFLMIDLQVY